MRHLRPFCFLLLAGLLGCQSASAEVRQRLDLGGVWDTELGACTLPGTTDESHLGPGNSDTTVTANLTRLWPYRGVVTYSRTIAIPSSFEGKRLTLIMERTKPSTLFVDGDSIGSLGHLNAPHVYVLPPLAAGEHRIEIRVDNSEKAVPKEVQGSHAWTDATQTNWNGILGDFCIEATNDIYLSDVQIYPDVDSKTARVVAHVGAKEMEERVIERTFELGNDVQLWSEFHPALYQAKVVLADCGGEPDVDVFIAPKDKPFATRPAREHHTPGEAHPKRVKRGEVLDEQTVTFGVRRFATEGTQFTINGFKTFLRGKHDGCVFPLTGYAPMDVESWRSYLQTCKTYGINHIRCHSWTPPRAAFEAADIEGVYLDVELPFWGTVDPKKEALNEFLHQEVMDILRSFGNHPSFMMMGLGNELWGDVPLMKSWLDEFRATDGRHLYCYGANNDLGYNGPKEGEDFYITCRVGGGESYATNVRSSFSFADEDQGGLLNNTRPNTVANYAFPVSLCLRPIISHESCQFQVYPDYKELSKYTGVLYPYNHEVFRRRLQDAGMGNKIDAFHKASGEWVVDCYKADIEYCLRTPGMGGYQMLDLQDYPGQGSALVGILDAFMDSKGITTPEAFRQFCAPVVPLAMFDDYCLSNSDTLHVALAVSDFEENDWMQPLSWHLEGENFSREGNVENVAVAQGAVEIVGEINCALSDITHATRLTLTLQTGSYSNVYNLWVYPSKKSVEFRMLCRMAPMLSTSGSNISVGDVTVCGSLADAMAPLTQGRKVLCLPSREELETVSVGGLFTPDYWNYAMFKSISENNKKPVSPGTLGLLADASHPLFKDFPCEGRSNWQWWSIVRHSNPVILDAASADLQPIIQVVDNVERNHRLGLLFECAVTPELRTKTKTKTSVETKTKTKAKTGAESEAKAGQLLICASRLDEIMDTPEGAAFMQALLGYMESDAFAPAVRMDAAGLRALFEAEVEQRDIQGVKNITDYTKPAEKK